MRIAFLAVTCALVLAPVVATAQVFTTFGPGAGEVRVFGPSPELRAKMDAARKQARTDALSALTPEHRAKVESIVSRLDSGALSPERATVQIEDLLTPEESKALAQREQQFHEKMRSIMESMPPPRPRSEDAARYLMMISGKFPEQLPPLPPPQP